MKVTAMTVPTSVEVEISVEEMLKRLKEECGVYETGNAFFEVSEGKLYKVWDKSYHGSPSYEKMMITDNPVVVKMYESILAFEDAYKQMRAESQT